MQQQDLFGNDEVRARMATERKLAARIVTENRKRMSRKKDRKTSIAAADRMHRASGTIRAAVEEFAVRRGYTGATDDEVRKHFGDDKPESSYRKRRTELAQDGILLETPRQRPNRNGEPVTVWVHKDFGRPGDKPVEPVETRTTRLKAAARALLAKADELIDEGEVLGIEDHLDALRGAL